MKTIATSILSMFMLTVVMTGTGVTGDLDDGISKFTDDGITKYDDMGKADRNVKFIVMNAKSKANMMKGDADKKGQNSGGSNMNSVILGAGGVVKGDIFIIDQSKGPKVNVSD